MKTWVDHHDDEDTYQDDDADDFTQCNDKKNAQASHNLTTRVWCGDTVIVVVVMMASCHVLLVMVVVVMMVCWHR